MVLKGFPNVVTQGQEYNIGEKPIVILYTYINHHAGTPKQKQRTLLSLMYNIFGVRIPDFSNMVIRKRIKIP